ncbi:MAG: LemA family protein [Minisyncoccia bacterium]
MEVMQNFWRNAALVLGGLLVIVLGGHWWNYAALNSGKNSAAAKLSDIAVMEQRRGDLVVQVLPVVEAAAKQERTVIDSVTKARAELGKVQVSIGSSQADLQKFVEAQNQFSSALSKLMVVVENYPQLKSLSNMQTFQSQLEGSENRIAVARVDYNGVVREYNKCVTGFFCSYTASRNGFVALPYLEAPAKSRDLPNTKIDLNKG